MPYIPEQESTAKIGFGLDHRRAELAVNYSGKIRTTAGQGTILKGGGIEDHTALALFGSYSGFNYFKVFAHILYFTNEVSMASRGPTGVGPILEHKVPVAYQFHFD